MNILIIGKYPPIEGGVARNNYYFAKNLAQDGNDVYFVTNSFEVEPLYRICLLPSDSSNLIPVTKKGNIYLSSSANIGERQNHIPQSDLFVTKLASAGAKICKSNKIDVLIVSYIEPYAIAGALLKSWFDLPSIFIHAGSDLGRLIKQPELEFAYREAITRYDVIGTNKQRHDQLINLGISPISMYPAPQPALDRTLFNKDAPKLDLIELFDQITLVSDNYKDLTPQRAKKIMKSRFILGAYSKIGDAKGSFDLLYALKMLKKENIDFHLIMLGGGRKEVLNSFTNLIASLDLKENVTLLPFLPNWLIPSFISLTDLMLFLENNFDIRSHSPIIPAEILLCQKSLIISNEVYAKQSFFNNQLQDEKNVITVNVKDHFSLYSKIKKIIENPELRKRLESNAYLATENLATQKEELESLYMIIDRAIELYQIDQSR